MGFFAVVVTTIGEIFAVLASVMLLLLLLINLYSWCFCSKIVVLATATVDLIVD